MNPVIHDSEATIDGLGKLYTTKMDRDESRQLADYKSITVVPVIEDSTTVLDGVGKLHKTDFSNLGILIRILQFVIDKATVKPPTVPSDIYKQMSIKNLMDDSHQLANNLELFTIERERVNTDNIGQYPAITMGPLVQDSIATVDGLGKLYNAEAIVDKSQHSDNFPAITMGPLVQDSRATVDGLGKLYTTKMAMDESQQSANYPAITIYPLLQESGLTVDGLGKLYKSKTDDSSTGYDYRAVTIKKLMDDTNIFFNSIGKVSKTPLAEHQASTARYSSLSIQKLLDDSYKLLDIIVKPRNTLHDESSPSGYKPISITTLMDDSRILLEKIGKIQEISLPRIPTISIKNYIDESQNILSNLKIRYISASLIRTDAYRNFITKLISDTSSAFDKYYPDSIKISEPHEWKQDEKRLQFKEPMVSTPAAEEPKTTYTADIENIGKNIYIPRITLDAPTPSAKPTQ
jgi:hypothetical protein